MIGIGSESAHMAKRIRCAQHNLIETFKIEKNNHVENKQ